MSKPIEDVLGLKTAENRALESQRPAALQPLTALFLRIFLWFLAASALLGVVTILGGEFGDFELKVMGTTLTISLGSLCAMCCVKCGSQRNLAAWSQSGVALTVFAALLLIVALWRDRSGDGHWQFAIIMAIAAVANAHVCALYFARLSSEHEWLQAAAAVVIACLALLMAMAVADSFDNTMPVKMIAVLAVLDVGLTIAIPILHRLDQATTQPLEAAPPETAAGLFVTANADGSYTLPDGRRLVLSEATSPKPPTGSA